MLMSELRPQLSMPSDGQLLGENRDMPPAPSKRGRQMQLLTAVSPIKPMKVAEESAHEFFSRPEILPWKDPSAYSIPLAQRELPFPDRRLLPLATYLEQVTILFLQACNVRSRKFMEAVVEKFVAPTLYVNKTEGFQSLSRASYIQGKVDFWKENAVFRILPRLTSAFVEESKGRAFVFSTNSVTGTVQERPELTRESVTIAYFEQRRRDGEWVITKFEAVRGPGHWTFEVGHPD